MSDDHLTFLRELAASFDGDGLHDTADELENVAVGIENLRERLDWRDAEMSAVTALVSSEDWPSIERMGVRDTRIRNDLLCDLIDILTQAKERESKGNKSHE